MAVATARVLWATMFPRSRSHRRLRKHARLGLDPHVHALEREQPLGDPAARRQRGTQRFVGHPGAAGTLREIDRVSFEHVTEACDVLRLRERVVHRIGDSSPAALPFAAGISRPPSPLGSRP